MIKHSRLLLLSLLGLLATTAARAEQFSVLLFSQTAGWHHESIHEGVTAIRDLGKLHDFTVFWTEDPARVFKDEELKKYKVVIFLSTTGDVLNDEQQAAFERYIKAGGGFVGIHAAADTEYGWPWYTKMVGHMFHIHPAVQSATMKVEDSNFPGMDRFPKRFLETEEWYEYDAARSQAPLPAERGRDDVQARGELGHEVRQGHGQIPPDRVVPGVRRWSRVLHGAGPSAGDL